jgi:SAM-dependent methyltransferase
VFGRDPAAYDRARLRYPDRIYRILTERCGLGNGTATFEIGPGTGIASRELLRLGADPLLLIEPDRRLARYLRETLRPRRARLEVSVRPFERAVLSPQSFGLGVAATSFHWLPERRSLRKIARALRPGGWWATWNNLHGDPSHGGEFHRALQPLYRELAGGRSGRPPSKATAGRQRLKRVRALRAVGAFDSISAEEIRWTAQLTTAQVTDLWGSFSEIVTLPSRKRRWFLTELGRAMDERFGGEVRLPVLTPMFTARRIDSSEVSEARRP